MVDVERGYVKDCYGRLIHIIIPILFSHSSFCFFYFMPVYKLDLLCKYSYEAEIRGTNLIFVITMLRS